ncbi:uncharacterized protein A1O5_10780 [Cladophialophora psammophila CBS 110553]|uniref:Fungal N-terminal domain-containing protein n=1 Tax=Cladophialophora psammophila CBS 110553 TaxID=1182543 RepID=W9X6T3_9EURO|nr:uncharacterized protein A1O5_10780 [Cladophialophora psammophila CBS 110553]EXJ66164.1 hypothetical protein A1O5_10780 [Cladophialophora psammophila CBS 110553]
MALATRRPLQIQTHVFDPRNDGLDEADVEDEMHVSEVYAAGVKRLLAGALSLQCSLASALTDLIMFVYSPRRMSHSPTNASDSLEQTMRKLKRIESDTKAWFERVSKFLPSVPTVCDSYDSCVFQLEVCQLYHWAGQTALQQYKILLLETQPEYARAGETFRKEAVRKMLADSIVGLNRSVRAYALRGSACSLPTEV